MPAPTDTGGLGLLQMLHQSGFPPQLLALLAQRLTQEPAPPPSEPNIGGGGPGGPGPAGSTTSGEGVPGVGPTNGTVTGIGNLSFGQAANAFGQGAAQSIPGVSLAQNIADMSQNGVTFGGAAKGVGQAVSLLGTLAHPNPAMIGTKAALNGLINMARAAQDSSGFRGPQTFSEAAKEFAQNLKDMTIRSFLGLPTPDPPFSLAIPLPSANRVDMFTPEDPSVPDTPTMSEADSNAISAAIAEAGSATPTSPDGPSGPPGDGGEGPSSGPAGSTGEF